MEREIKFRGKRVDNGDWVYGYYWRDNSNGKHKITVDLSDDNFRCYEVIPETVGQYIGLKDKHGKEIYEGDIVKCDGGKFPAEVAWSNLGMWALNTHREETINNPFESYCLDEATVIGNVFQNPELIKEAA